jgi:hypothetical protein
VARVLKTDPIEVAGELDRLGVPAEALQQAVAVGLGAAARYRSRKFPVIMPGIVAWGESVGSLRDGLATHGWEPKTENNYETVVNPKTRIAIAVAAGDEKTGVTGSDDPATKSSKGLFTETAAVFNQQTLDLWTGTPSPEPTAGFQTWLLLFAYAMTDREIRLELSLPMPKPPARRSKTWRVRSWDERIIIPSIPFELPPLADAVGGDGGSPSAPDIEIRRR